MATLLVQPLATVRVQLQPWQNLNKNVSKKVSNLSFQPYHNELVVRYPISTHKNRVHSRVISIRAETTKSPAQLWQDIKDREFSLDDFKKLRQDFLNVLRSRRSEVPLTVEPAEPVTKPLYQREEDLPLPEGIAMRITNHADNFNDLFVQENFYLRTEDSEQGRVPVLIISKKQNVKTKRPAIVFLHPTTANKEYVSPYLKAFASRDYVAIAIDARYHGERAKSKTSYQEALISAWKNGDTMPFIYDTVWDLIKLNDYLITRDDIDSDRIGMSGISLGGMHTWFAGFADPRYAVLAPMIGVQGFRWAIDNNKWQGRVFSELKPMFEEAAKDMGKSEIDIEVVEKVWERIAPGLASMFDSPYTIPGKATRPLLIVNAQNDPRNPIGGLEIPKTRATKLYESQQVGPNFKLHIEPNLHHEVNENMIKVVSDWFDKHLLNLEA